MKYKLCVSLIVLIAVILHSCQKDPISPNGIQPVNKTRYYQNEILLNSLKHVYGYWDLTLVGGGISGGLDSNGSDYFFDAIEFKPFGIYGLYKNQLLLEYGRIKIDKENLNQGILVYLVPDQNSKEILYPFNDMRYQMQVGNNTLFIDPNDINDAVGYAFDRVR